MTPRLFNTNQAVEYLGIPIISLKRYIKDPDVPIEGTLVTPRSRVFTQEELDSFKQYIEQHPEMKQRGRRPDPDAPYHGWREGKRRAAPINTQRVADGIKALVLAKKGNPEKRKAALEAINHFESLAWYPAAFAENCARFDLQPDGVVYLDERGLFDAVIDSLAAYEQAVQR